MNIDKKRYYFGGRIAASMLLAGFLLSGCSFSTANKVATIDDVYDAWIGVTDLSYEMHILKSSGEVPGEDQASSFTLYTKDKTKTRMEVAMGDEQSVFISDVDGGVNILYYPTTNSYIDFGPGEEGQESTTSELDGMYEELRNGFTVDGHEALNGKDTFKIKGKSEGVDQLIWVDAELLLPVKFQTLTTLGAVSDDVELTNLSVDTLSDELFVVPADATEAGFEEFLQGLIPPIE